MRKKYNHMQRGFIKTPFLIAILAVLLLAGGSYYVDTKKLLKSSSDTTAQVQQPNTVLQPRSANFCNGQNWGKCPDGQNFVCPSTGEAYCEEPQAPVTRAPTTQYEVQQQTQVYTPPVQVQGQDNTAVEMAARDKAVEVVNNIVSGYGNLDSLAAADIDSMNQIVGALSGQNTAIAKAIINLTNLRIQRIQQQRAALAPIIAQAKSDRAYLQAQPLSFFLTYQTPGDTLDGLNYLTTAQQNYVSDYNLYTTALKQGTTPINVPRSVYCSYSGGGGYGTITCN